MIKVDYCEGFVPKAWENHEFFIKLAIQETGYKEADIESILVGLKNDETYDITVSLNTKVKFEKIRRITGYLTGTVDRWNNAKRAEERDRVKHGL